MSAPLSIPLLSVGSLTSCTYKPPKTSPACAGLHSPAAANTARHKNSRRFIGSINASILKTCRSLPRRLPCAKGVTRREQHPDVERQVVADHVQRNEFEHQRQQNRRP